MKLIFLIVLLTIIYGCSKPKTVLICGDHICINKKEAEQYFEENLSIEVKIIDKKNKKDLDLVELNLNNNDADNKSVSISKKNNLKKELKTLSKQDVLKLKEKIKTKSNNKKLSKKTSEKKDIEIVKIKKKDIVKKDKNAFVGKNMRSGNVIDVCTILKKCSIDEISEYLLKESKKKGFPNIATRQ